MKALASIALVSLCFSTQAQAASMDCSSSNGKVQMSSWAKEGGAHPGNGMVIGSETWKFNGQETGSRTQHYLAEDKVTGRLGQMVEGSEVIVDDSKANAKPVGTIKLTVKVIAPKSATGSATVKTTVLCTKTFATVPIP